MSAIQLPWRFVVTLDDGSQIDVEQLRARRPPALIARHRTACRREAYIAAPPGHRDLRARAARYLRRERRDHTLQPTALIHEAYLRLVDHQRVDWQNRAHFLAIAAKMMRRILVDHARRRNAVKRPAHVLRVALDDQVGGGTCRL